MMRNGHPVGSPFSIFYRLTSSRHFLESSFRSTSLAASGTFFSVNDNSVVTTNPETLPQLKKHPYYIAYNSTKSSPINRIFRYTCSPPFPDTHSVYQRFSGMCCCGGRKLSVIFPSEILSLTFTTSHIPPIPYFSTPIFLHSHVLLP